MSCGAVVLASDTQPVREVIENGRNGLLADFHDVDSWVAKADRVLDHLADYRPLAMAGAKTIRERYSLEVCFPRLQCLLDTLTSRV